MLATTEVMSSSTSRVAVIALMDASVVGERNDFNRGIKVEIWPGSRTPIPATSANKISPLKVQRAL